MTRAPCSPRSCLRSPDKNAKETRLFCRLDLGTRLTSAKSGCHKCLIIISIYASCFFLGPGKANARRVPKDGPGLVKKTKVRAKNPRTTFSFLQKLALENEFRRTPYPTVALRAQLAEKLGLRQEVVQVIYIQET